MLDVGDGEMQNAIMKVMTKIFSAKVVLERLPEHQNVIIKEEIFESDELNYDPVPEQINKRTNSDEFSDICATENVNVKEESVDPDETNCDPVPRRRSRYPKDFMSHMITKICPKHCNIKLQGSISGKNCRNCKKSFTFKCKKCDKTVSTYDGIKHHLSTKCHFQGDYYQCPYCPCQSVLRYTIVCHMRAVHSNKQYDSIKKINHEEYQKNLRKFVYNCLKCGQGFRKWGRFRTHCRLYCDNLDHAIDRSNEIDTKGNFEIPDMLLAKEMSVRYCSTCNEEKDFDNTNKCSKCNKPLLFKCSNCNITHSKVHYIIRHLRVKCAVGKNYKCSKCEYTNAIQMLVLAHYKNVHEPTPVECTKCGSILKNKSTFIMHKRYCNKKANLSCNIGKCSFVTHNPDCLRAHKKRHTQKDNTDCPKCGKLFLNRVSMKTHLFHCGKPLNYLCDHCPYVSKFKRDLQNHMLRKHLREINNEYNVCPKCGVVFKYNRSSKGHLRFCGTSERHFECNFCYFMTHDRYSLRCHLLKLHSGKNGIDKTEEE